MRSSIGRCSSSRVLAWVCGAAAVGLGADAARADGIQLGFDFGGGPVAPIHGELGPELAPIVWARAGLVLHVPGWGAEAGVVALNGTAEGGTALGGTAALRRYVPLAAGERNRVRWRVAAYGAAGWTHARRSAERIGPATSATLAAAPMTTAPAAPTAPTAARVAGPRLGAGVELALSQRDTLVWSRISIQGTYQQLGAIDGARDGAGFASAELAFTTSIGR
jgi:hypothetical protein